MGIEFIMTITKDQIGLVDKFYGYTIKGDKFVVVIDGVESEADFDVDGDIYTFATGDKK